MHRVLKHGRTYAQFRQVNYNPECIKQVVTKLYGAFPNELGGFLLAEPNNTGGGETFNVAGVMFGEVGTPGNWSFSQYELTAAMETAGKCNLVVCGMFHSHPWQKPPYSMTFQSSADAELQKYYNLPLSLIVGICPDYWISATWRMGYAAPYPEIVNGMPLYKWAKSSRSRILRKHFYCVK